MKYIANMLEKDWSVTKPGDPGGYVEPFTIPDPVQVSMSDSTKILIRGPVWLGQEGFNVRYIWDNDGKHLYKVISQETPPNTIGTYDDPGGGEVPFFSCAYGLRSFYVNDEGYICYKYQLWDQDDIVESSETTSTTIEADSGDYSEWAVDPIGWDIITEFHYDADTQTITPTFVLGKFYNTWLCEEVFPNPGDVIVDGATTNVILTVT